jgi:hypothetical protein
MKIIHAGGVNGSLGRDDPNYMIYGFGNYFAMQIKDDIQSLINAHKKIAVCVAAKPDKHHYDQRFVEMGFALDDLIFLGRNDMPDWSNYSAILLLGGDTAALHSWLVNTGFAVNKLTQCQLLAGDSAGAYVLARYTMLNYTPNGSKLEISTGFIPELNILVAAHTNNAHYHQPGLEATLRDWCNNNQTEYVPLEENEIKIHV